MVKKIPFFKHDLQYLSLFQQFVVSACIVCIYDTNIAISKIYHAAVGSFIMKENIHHNFFYKDCIINTVSTFNAQYMSNAFLMFHTRVYFVADREKLISLFIASSHRKSNWKTSLKYISRLFPLSALAFIRISKIL